MPGAGDTGKEAINHPWVDRGAVGKAVEKEEGLIKFTKLQRKQKVNALIPEQRI